MDFITKMFLFLFVVGVVLFTGWVFVDLFWIIPIRATGG